MKDFDEWKVERRREVHIADSLKMLDDFSPMLARTYSWHVMRWERRHLLTCDSPLVLVPDPEMPPVYGVGLATAQTIYISISRSCCLLLRNRADPEWDVQNGRVFPGTTTSARAVNILTVANAARWLYHHPEDSITNLLGPKIKLPTPREVTFEDAHNRELRRRLKIMAEYAWAHPDEPHPMSPDAPPFDWSAYPPDTE